MRMIPLFDYWESFLRMLGDFTLDWDNITCIIRIIRTGYVRLITDLFSHWHRKFGQTILGKEYHCSNRSLFSFSLELRTGHLLVASITYIVLQESKFVKFFLRWSLWVSTGKALWWKAEKTVNIMLYVICFLIIITVWLRWQWFRYLIERVTDFTLVNITLSG